MSKFNTALSIIISILISYQAVAQSNIETFGKNRVQYRTFGWQYYEYDRLRIYYYDRGGKELARFVAELVERDIKAIERTMNASFPPRLNIILYNNYDEYMQTNIGLETELEISEKESGNLEFKGDKLYVYFNGKHADLKKQLRSGIAEVVLERALFGEGTKDIAKNQLFQNIPQWIAKGYVHHIVNGWDADTEELMKQLLFNDKITFEEIVRANPDLAGQAFWKYVSKKYGHQEVRNLFFNIISKNSLSKAIKQTYQIPQRYFYDSIVADFRARYQFESQLTEATPEDTAIFTIIPANDDVSFQNIKVSPRGNDVAYTTFENGVHRVHLEKTNKQKATNERVKSTLLTLGITDHTAQPDPNYPILAWSHTGFKLGMMYRKNNVITLKVYDAIKGKMQNFRIKSNRFDRVLSFTFMEEDEVIILSAIKNAQTDLFEYRFKNGRVTQLTDDTYDDLEPTYVTGGARRGILFLSNRKLPYLDIRTLPNELPLGPLNAYFYNTTTQRMELFKLTDKKSDWVEDIIPYGPDYFSYLSAETGIRNRYIVLFNRDENNMDTAYSVPVTNYNTNIFTQQYNPASASIAEVLKEKNVYNIYFRKTSLPAPVGNAPIKDPIIIKTIDTIDLLKVDKANDSIMAATVGGIKIKINNDFHTEFSNEISPASNNTTKDENTVSDKQSSIDFSEALLIAGTDSNQAIVIRDFDADYDDQGRKIMFVDSTYIKLRSKPYLRSFKIKEITGRIDNSMLFNRYQNFNSNFGTLSNPDLGGLIMFQLIDRMEDYRLTGGFRFTPSFTTNYILKFENIKRRLDWGITFFNSTERQIADIYVINQGAADVYSTPMRNRISVLQGHISYPFNRVQRISFTASYRKDQGVFKGSNPLAIIIPDIEEEYWMNRLEFVQDNTRILETNIRKGMRFKTIAEYVWKFKSVHPNDQDTTINNGKPKTGGFYNFGFDFRYYKPLYKNITLALRGVGAHAGGSHQIMYILGGVDNSMYPQYNQLLLPTEKNNYAFQALATNLRGYPQNARNGNTYALLNTEIRVPIFSTFFKRPINNRFLKYLQLVAFVDAGSAWEGLLPDYDFKRMNTFFYPDPYLPQVTVTIPYDKPYGLALGYGMGLRSYIYSYYYRLDFARNIEKKNSIHFSIGFDF